MDLKAFNEQNEAFGFNLNEERDNSDFEIQWRDLGYTVTNSLFTRGLRRIQGFRNVPKKKTILDNVSGRVRSGELVAFIGPSGAGKSTLMECIVGSRIIGRTGDAFIISDDLKNIKVSFIAQKNNFLTQLTVRETILFAARLQISTKAMHGIVEPLFEERGKLLLTKPGGIEYCRVITDRVIAVLGLESCADNRIPNCSGGQLKRLAIAQELVAGPRILVLDEPTSGLDSASCLQVIQMLRTLCESRLQMTVLASIHQPSYKVLCLFHKMYVLSSTGDIVYDNSPLVLNEEFTRFNLKCPAVYNPADFIIEVATGEHGTEVLGKMVQYHRELFKGNRSNFENCENCKPLSHLNQESKFPEWSHIWILCQRNMLVTIRDPFVFGVSLAATIATPAFLTTLYGSSIGVRGGCPPKFDADFEPSQLDYIGDEIEAELKSTYNNAGNMFVVVLFCMFNSLMTTCLGFPWEMIVFKTEKHNLWYSDIGFFLGKTCSEIPIQMLFLVLYYPVQHLMQNQIPELWRGASMAANLFLVQLIAQTFGYISGSLLMHNVAASILLGPIVCIIPFVLLCGLFLKTKNMSPLFSVLSWFSYLRFSMEGILVSLYGFNRCGDSKSDLKEGREAFIVWMSAMLGVYGDGSETSTRYMNDTDYTTFGSPSERFVEELIDTIAGDFISDRNEVRSLVMNKFALEDWYLIRAIIVNIIYLLVMRFIAFLIISAKVRVKIRS